MLVTPFPDYEVISTVDAPVFVREKQPPFPAKALQLLTVNAVLTNDTVVPAIEARPPEEDA